ncbi:MAG: M23/M56 family metallopeptidase [Parvularculaceae bacterium]
MSGLLEFNAYQGEALLICLAASLVWAGMLLVGARGLERAAPMTSAEKLWTSALLFAVLPSLVAPTLAALGVSLRPMPEAVALEAAPQMTYVESSTAGAPAQPAQAPLVTTAQLIGGAALLYVYGAVLAFFLWAGRQACLQYAVARAQLIEDWDLYDRIEDWAERLEVRMPTIRRSRHVSSVCITGVARQTILVPEGIETRIGSDDLVLMCAHELAHVRRGDTRLFTATQLARVLFWFNPLVGRIARNAELAAEESADALVLDKGVDRRAYAACFVEGLKFAASKMNMQPALAPSFTPADPGGRRRRLNAILSPQAPKKTPLATRLLLSAAASTVALAAFGQAALAVDPESAGTQNSLLQNLPLVGEISQEFGDRRETAGVDDASAHSGVDIKAPMGAKIFAPGDGVVVEATSRYKGSTDWGKVVVIDHGHGFVTRFAHLDAYRVKKGDRVKAGEMIATVGVTGKTTGPHLHFETLRDGEPVDPANVIAAAPVAEPAAEPHPAAEPKPAAAQKPAGVARPSRTLRYSYKFAPAGEIPARPASIVFRRRTSSRRSASTRLNSPGLR